MQEQCGSSLLEVNQNFIWENKIPSCIVGLKKNLEKKISP